MESGGKGFGGGGSRGKSYGGGRSYGNNNNVPSSQNQLPFLHSGGGSGGGGGGGGSGSASKQNSTRFSSNTSSAYMDAAHTDPGNMFPATPYTAAADLFMSNHLRNKFQSGSATQRNTTVASAKFAHFTAITNVDDKAVESSLHRELHTQVYRTTNRFSGKHVLLRRVVNATATAADCTAICDRLRHFRHPSLVPLHSITPTTEFVLGSTDIIVEHRLIKRAKSVDEAFFGSTRPGQMPAVNPNETSSGPQQEQHVTEGLLWSIACQLVGLLKMFHDAQTPLRGLHLSKLMFQDVIGRIYFTGLGLIDLVDPAASNATLETLFKYDVRQLGIVLYQLATMSWQAPLNANAATTNLRMRFSPGFAQLVATCLEGTATVDQLCHGLGDRLAMEVGHQCGNVDYLFHECGKEVHNGRLMRLMIKLNFAVESANSDSGTSPDVDEARFILRMFNQYVFNQVDEQNRVRADWGHVFHTLNKLDCSSDELVQLISGDALTVMVIAYRDIRMLLDRVFELTTAPAQEMSFAAISTLQSNAMTPPTAPQPQQQ